MSINSGILCGNDVGIRSKERTNAACNSNCIALGNIDQNLGTAVLVSGSKLTGSAVESTPVECKVNSTGTNDVYDNCGSVRYVKRKSMACTFHRSSSAALEFVKLVNSKIEYVNVVVCTLECYGTIIVSDIICVCAVIDSYTVSRSEFTAEILKRCESGIEINTALNVSTVDSTGNVTGYCCTCALLSIEISDIVISADCKNAFSVTGINVIHCGLLIVTAEEYVVTACDAKYILDRGSEVFILVFANAVSGIAVVCGRRYVKCRAGQSSRKYECSKSLAQCLSAFNVHNYHPTIIFQTFLNFTLSTIYPKTEQQ